MTLRARGGRFPRFPALLYGSAQGLLALFIFGDYLTGPRRMLSGLWDRQVEAAETLVLVSAVSLLAVLVSLHRLIDGRSARVYALAMVIGAAGTVLDALHMALRLAGADVYDHTILIDLVAHSGVAIGLLAIGGQGWRQGQFPGGLAALLALSAVGSVAARAIVPVAMGRVLADGVLSVETFRWVQLNIWLARGENAINAVWAFWLAWIVRRGRTRHEATYASAVAR